MVNQEALKSWLDAYGRAWETRDPDAVIKLFTEDATYQETPFSEPMRGRAAIREYWAEKVARSQEQVSFGYEVLALAGDLSLAHWWASFVRTRSKSRVKLDGIFLLSFDSQDRCRALVVTFVLQRVKNKIHPPFRFISG